MWKRIAALIGAILCLGLARCGEPQESAERAESSWEAYQEVQSPPTDKWFTATAVSFDDAPSSLNSAEEP